MPSGSVERLESLLADQPAVPLKPNQLREYETERNRLTAIVDGKDHEGNAVPWVPGDRAAAARRRRQIDKTLVEQAPKPLGPKASEVYRLATEVIQGDIRPAMMSHAVMRRNPAGAVGEFNRRENSPQIKRTILTVKRALRALDPYSDDPDLCNMERFRPTGEGPNGASTFDVSATIPGNFAMTPQAKENWPLGEPTVDTPLKQARRQEPIEPVRKKRMTLTPEQRQAIGERFRLGREAKRLAREIARREQELVTSETSSAAG